MSFFRRHFDLTFYQDATQIDIGRLCVLVSFENGWRNLIKLSWYKGEL